MTRLESLNAICLGLGGVDTYTDELSVWQAIQTQMEAIVAVLNGISGDSETIYQAAMSKVVIQQGGTGAGDILTLCNELASLFSVGTETTILGSLNAIITELGGTTQTDILAAYTELGTLLNQETQPFAVFRADGSNAFNGVLVFPTENAEPMVVDWGDGSEPEAFYNSSKKKGGYAYFLSHDYTGITQDCNITLSLPLTDCIFIGLWDNAGLIQVQDLTGLTALQVLSFYGCTSLTTPPDLTGLTALQYLFLSGCTSLTTPPDLTGCTAFQYLDLNGCTALDQSDVDTVLGYFATLYEFCTQVELTNTAIPTPATLLAAQSANPQCTFNVDTE